MVTFTGVGTVESILGVVDVDARFELYVVSADGEVVRLSDVLVLERNLHYDIVYEVAHMNRGLDFLPCLVFLKFFYK